MRRGESSYIGRDADGNPSGFATLPTGDPGEVVSAPTKLQLAERTLDKAREEWLNNKDDGALDRYVAAVIARNEARERAAS